MVEESYSKYKRQSSIVYQGNPSTGTQNAKVSELKPAMQRHDELYKHYHERQQKIKELQEIKAQNDMVPYTFRPNLDKTQKKAVKSKRPQ